MELPGAEAAASAAGLADEFVGFRFVFEGVEGFLNGAFDVAAEFAGFILGVSFEGHRYRLRVSLAGLYLIRQKEV
jgi:hypothetical protein